MVNRTCNLIRNQLLRMSLGPVIFEINPTQNSKFKMKFLLNNSRDGSREKWNSSRILINHPSSHTVYRSDIKCQIVRQLKCYLELIPDKTNNLFIWTHSPVHVYRSRDTMGSRKNFEISQKRKLLSIYSKYRFPSDLKLLIKTVFFRSREGSHFIFELKIRTFQIDCFRGP